MALTILAGPAGAWTEWQISVDGRYIGFVQRRRRGGETCWRASAQRGGWLPAQRGFLATLDALLATVGRIFCPACHQDAGNLVYTLRLCRAVCEACLRRVDPAGMARIDAMRARLAEQLAEPPLLWCERPR